MKNDEIKRGLHTQWNGLNFTRLDLSVQFHNNNFTGVRNTEGKNHTVHITISLNMGYTGLFHALMFVLSLKHIP